MKLLLVLLSATMALVSCGPKTTYRLRTRDCLYRETMSVESLSYGYNVGDTVTNNADELTIIVSVVK
jgi:hypothetical protein